MVAPRISLAVGPWTGSAPTQAVASFDAGEVKMSLAAGAEVRFRIAGKDPAALQTSGLATDVWVLKHGSVFQRCRVLPVDQGWGPDGQDDVAIIAVGYKRVIEARHIISGPPTFTSDDQGDILWALVQHTQAQVGGDLGVTEGAHTTGVVRDRTDYKIGDNLGKLMTDLGNVIDGAWWGIDAALEFTAKLWTDFTVRTDPIVLGVNANHVSRTRGKAFANAAGAIGSVTDTTATWVAAGDVGTDPRGRWEAFDASHGSVTEQTTVDEYADGLLASRSTPPGVWKIDLDVAWYFEKGSDYAPGEFVRVAVPVSAVDEVGVPPIDVLTQITEVTIAFNGDDATGVTIAAEEVE